MQQQDIDQQEDVSNDDTNYYGNDDSNDVSEDKNVKRRHEDLTKWRKEQAFTMWSKGWTQTRIANELQCAQSTVSADLAFIFKQTEHNLANHLAEGIPRQWAQCLQGLKTIMAEGWNIYDSISNDNTVRITDKTTVLALIKDCYKHMLELNADSTIVSECILFSKRANNKLQPYQLQQQPQPQLEQQVEVQQMKTEQSRKEEEVEQQ
jgi:hypothetical protein